MLISYPKFLFTYALLSHIFFDLSPCGKNGPHSAGGKLRLVAQHLLSSTCLVRSRVRFQLLCNSNAQGFSALPREILCHLLSLNMRTIVWFSSLSPDEQKRYTWVSRDILESILGCWIFNLIRVNYHVPLREIWMMTVFLICQRLA